MENSGQPVRYLTFEDILIVAQRHVGSYQLLKENQLRYLVQMVGEKLGDTELFPTLPLKAAVYAHHIIAGHIFLDGNKRIGLDCALWFLTMNGCSLRRDINESIIELGLSIADGTTTDLEAIAHRIQSWTLKIINQTSRQTSTVKVNPRLRPDLKANATRHHRQPQRKISRAHQPHS